MVETNTCFTPTEIEAARWLITIIGSIIVGMIVGLIASR
jgi:ABC-type antimicrobial peptide transport system permease subunit